MEQQINLAKKTAVIGLLAVGLLIPILMLMDLADERQQRRNEVVQKISETWSRPAYLSPPIMVGPGGAVPVDDVSISVDAQTILKKQNIYAIPAYSAKVTIVGQFAKLPAGHRIHIIVHDPDSVWIKDAACGKTKIHFLPKTNSKLALFDNSIYSRPLPKGVSGRCTFDLELQGIETFRFLALSPGHYGLNSNWSSPGFEGGRLPYSYEPAEKRSGFSAAWRVRSVRSNQIRKMMPRLIKQAAVQSQNGEQTIRGSLEQQSPAVFGSRFYHSGNPYIQTERAIKYSFLFICLTFLFFFIHENLKGVRIHPFQYGLIGAALCVFFLLLLALSELIPFWVAYLLGATATVGLIHYYAAVLTQGARYLTPALIGLYVFLYTLLSLGKYSLVLGSILLFAILAVVMILTRRLDWYSMTSSQGQATEQT